MKHLGPYSDVTVDIFPGKEFGVPRSGVVKTCQFIIKPLLVLMIHRMVDRGEEDLDLPLAPIVGLVCFFIRDVGETEGYANHLTWEVGAMSQTRSSVGPRMIASPQLDRPLWHGFFVMP